MKNDDEFKRGAIVALCTLHSLHDQPTICSEALIALGITKTDCRKADIGDYDKKLVAEIWKAARPA